VAGSFQVQHFASLPADLKHAVQELLTDFAPRGANPTEESTHEMLHVDTTSPERTSKELAPPAKFAMPGRYIGTVSSVVLMEGVRMISCSKLPQRAAAFDTYLAPQDAVEGALVAFHTDDANPPLAEGYAHATALEVLSLPSPANRSRLGAAATAAAGKKAVDAATREQYQKCFPCRAALKGSCQNGAACPDAHTLAEVRPLPDKKEVRRIAKKLFGKAALHPMVTPQPMSFGMMPPPAMGMSPMGMGMNPMAMLGMMPPLFPMSSKRRKRA